MGGRSLARQGLAAAWQGAGCRASPAGLGSRLHRGSGLAPEGGGAGDGGAGAKPVDPPPPVLRPQAGGAAAFSRQCGRRVENGGGGDLF